MSHPAPSVHLASSILPPDDSERSLDNRDLPTNRLEAFSDGVLAVTITITVLELNVPTVAYGVNRDGVWLALAFFVAVAVMWLAPDRRIEGSFARGPEAGAESGVESTGDVG